jgi:hypothetical protein
MVEQDGGARIAIFLAALGLAFGGTVPKLYTMARIKGWVPGAVVTHEMITQKGIAHARRTREDDVYWLSWSNNTVRDEDARRGSKGLFYRLVPWADQSGGAWTLCVRVEPEAWKELEVGDPLEVIRIPGDESAYHRNDAFVDAGQFVIDFPFLAVEITVAIVVLIQIIRRYRRSRAATLEGSPPTAQLPA